MVVGHGLLGKAFSSYEDNSNFLIFCSGVSNSTCTNTAEFQRETDLLQFHIGQSQSQRLVYFSTCSIYDESQQDRPYVQHKLNMERLIQTMHSNYLIVRTSNLVGKTTNPNTVLNFLFQAIQQETPFELWAHAERNLMDVQDVYRVVDYSLKHQYFTNRIIAVANPQAYPVSEIVKALELFIGKKANFTRVNKGQPFSIPLADIEKVYADLSLHFDDHYLSNLLQRYYTS